MFWACLLSVFAFGYLVCVDFVVYFLLGCVIDFGFVVFIWCFVVCSFVLFSDGALCFCVLFMFAFHLVWVLICVVIWCLLLGLWLSLLIGLVYGVALWWCFDLLVLL